MKSILTVTDAGANTSYKVNAAAGEYGILSCSAGGAYSGSAGSGSVGLIFYQAGIAVLSSSVFHTTGTGSGVLGADAIYLLDASHTTFDGALAGTSISGCADNFRHRIQDISFNNTTELNSTISPKKPWNFSLSMDMLY